MKQVIQNFKTGKLSVLDVPANSLNEGEVLVQNKFSLISSGTELSTISMGKSNLLEKAKKRPDLVKQVINNFYKEGFTPTIKKVMNKLDSLKALGYSSSGVVIESSIPDFKIGDRVACAGQDIASHAEIISVPRNLLTKVPDNVDLDVASFTTLGSIALQGIRQASPMLGENICVIGLGLLGQLTSLMLKSNGCNVMGIDIDEKMINFSNSLNSCYAVNRKSKNLINNIQEFTNGYDFDKVIITAATNSDDPIDLSCQILRKKGLIVVVGDVKMNIKREPYFYKKELELKISTSYGPGRYDVQYETFGVDYPLPYVRWSENRNMEAFIKLLSNNFIDISSLVTKVFNIENAEKAYNLISTKQSKAIISVLLKYSSNLKSIPKTINLNLNKSDKPITIGFIGAGSFAQSYLIPNLNKNSYLDTVVTKTGYNSLNVAKKFKFKKCSTDPNEIFNNKNLNTVFIASQHDTHYKFILESIKSNKNIFVEKPICLKEDELNSLFKNLKNYDKQFFVGYNRRFAPTSVFIKNKIKNFSEPLVINYRINAGYIPHDHWIQTKKGGGRILGEVCHFIDLLIFFTNSIPVKVYAELISSKNKKIIDEDNISIIIKFKNGSIANILYHSNGSKKLSKERIEIHSQNNSFILDDFKNVISYSSGIKKMSSNSKKF